MNGTKFINANEALLSFTDIFNVDRPDKEALMLQCIRDVVNIICPETGGIPQKRTLTVTDSKILLPCDRVSLIGITDDTNTRLSLAFPSKMNLINPAYYRIGGNYAYFNFTNKEITVYYTGLPTDANNVLWILNDVYLIEAIHYKILLRLMFGGYIHPTLSLVNVAQLYNEAELQAKQTCNTLSTDALQAITAIWTTPIPKFNWNNKFNTDEDN